jgi:hypothetical protein
MGTVRAAQAHGRRMLSTIDSTTITPITAYSHCIRVTRSPPDVDLLAAKL